MADSDDLTDGARFQSRVAARPQVNHLKGAGVGRNIFQSDHPVAMIRAVRAVVHESAKPEHAFEEFVRPALHGS